MPHLRPCTSAPEKGAYMSFSDIFLMINYQFISFLGQYDIAFWGAFIVIITGILGIGKIMRSVKI